MKRIIVNPSGDEQQNFIQDMVIDLVLGVFGFLGLVLTTACGLRFLLGTPLLAPTNWLLILLGCATIVTMIRIHRETAMPGEGTFWMTRRTKVGTFLHCLIGAYTLFLMGVAFDIPPFRLIPVWVYDLVTGFV